MSEKREGYQFVGWYIDKECTKRLNPGGVLPHSVTLYDKWIPIWYPIEYDVDGGVMSRRNPRYTCIESEELLLYPAFKKGVMFVGWQFNGEIITSLPAGIHEPVILTAIYKECPVIHFETCGGANYMDICTDEHGLLGDLKPPVRVTQNIEKCRFTTTGRSHNGYKFTFFYIQTNMIQRYCFYF